MHNFNPNDIYEKLVTLGCEWAEVHEAAEMLEETKKTLLSNLMAECDEKSQSAKEAYALRHPEYIRHVNSMVKARKLANKAKVRYDSAKIWAELKRTEAANLRHTGGYAT